MSDVRVNGIRLYYEEHGEGAPIACIHGTGSAAVLWEDAVGRLAELGRVIAYDRRGHTRSERPDPIGPTSVSDHADDAAALLDALDAAPAVVLGRSYGGEVALDLALRHPGKVRALVLLEGAPLCLSPESAAYDAALTERLLEVESRDGVDAVGEARIGEVLGGEAWRSFPDELRRLFTDNGPAIVAELRGGAGLRVGADELNGGRAAGAAGRGGGLAGAVPRGDRGARARAPGRARGDGRRRAPDRPGRPGRARVRRGGALVDRLVTLHPKDRRSPISGGTVRDGPLGGRVLARGVLAELALEVSR